MKYFLGLICQKEISSKDYGRKKSQNAVAVGRSEGFLGNPGENLVGEDCRWSEGMRIGRKGKEEKALYNTAYSSYEFCYLG